MAHGTSQDPSPRSDTSAGPPADVDVLVVGGGPAGLACALYLARFRRSVLLVDDSRSRTARIPCTRNYPGFADGVAGEQLLAGIRAQAARHEARFAAGRVNAIERRGEGFAVRWNGGCANARRVVLATGVSDVPPTMPHLADALAQGALRYCPVCDGFETRHQAVGIIADHGCDTFEALYVRHFTDRLTVFVVSADVRFTETQTRELQRADIRLVPEPVRSIRLWEGRITVGHGNAETVVDSMYCALGMQVHSDLAVALGARHDHDGYLLTDQHHQTTVAGLYAVGDVVKGLNQIAVAVGGAAIATSAIHLGLLDTPAVCAG